MAHAQKQEIRSWRWHPILDWVSEATFRYRCMWVLSDERVVSRARACSSNARRPARHGATRFALSKTSILASRLRVCLRSTHHARTQRAARPSSPAFQRFWPNKMPSCWNISMHSPSFRQGQCLTASGPPSQCITHHNAPNTFPLTLRQDLAFFPSGKPPTPVALGHMFCKATSGPECKAGPVA